MHVEFVGSVFTEAEPIVRIVHCEYLGVARLNYTTLLLLEHREVNLVCDTAPKIAIFLHQIVDRGAVLKFE